MMKKLLYSGMACFFAISAAGQTYNLSNGTFNTCSGNFYDDGGSGANYTKGVTKTITFCSTGSNCVSINFTSMDILAADALEVFDGTGTTKLITNITNGNFGNKSPVVSSSGCLTVRFTAASTGGARAGWAATISCGACPPPYIVVTPNPTTTQIQSLLFGPDVTVTNFKITCPSGAYGTFDAAGANLGLNKGLLLTSGSAKTAEGPNDQPDAGLDNNGPGDACLEAYWSGTTNPCTVGGSCSQAGCNSTSTTNGVCTCMGCQGNGGVSYDACGIEFDVTPTCDSLKINYIWASEEYPEYVNANVSDAFGFFISGPGITGNTPAACNNAQNVALIPGAGLPVSIDNLNVNKNQQFYVPNGNNQVGVQYDALTKVLTAGAKVIPCSTYHVKIVVADFGDGIYDSGVFLQDGGINCGTPKLAVTGTDAVECCADGSFTITLDQVPTSNTTIYYQLGGTASSGSDYNPLTGSVVIPAGQLTATIPVSVTSLCDGITEGNETLQLTVGQAICGGILNGTYTINISESPKANAGTDVTMCSSGGGVTLNGTGGGTYSWSPSTGLSCTTCPNPLATPTVTTTYVLTTTSASGCVSKDTVVVTVSCGPVVVVNNGAVCPSACTNLTATGSGGTGPYTYTWTPNIGSGAGPHNVCPASNTTYTVTVRDNAGNTSTATGTVSINPAPSLNTTAINVSCFNGTNGSATVTPSGASSPYTYLWSPSGGTGSMTPASLSPGTYTVTTTDANGCSSTTTAVVGQPTDITFTTGATPSNCGQSNGTATATPAGGTGPYTFLWNNSQSGTIASNLSSGNYTVTITDNKGCSKTTTVAVPSNGLTTAAITASTDVACSGGNNGTATANGGGGTAPFTYTWSNGNTGTNINGLTQGIYTVTVMDATGCPATASVTILAPGAIILTTSKTDANCGGSDGSATVSATGGTGSYTYQWSAGSTTVSQTGVSQGSYTVTVTDANGCSTTSIISVGDVGSPSLNAAGTNIKCSGQSTGTITSTVSAGVLPYTYLWSSGQTTPNISNVSAGTYTLTVTGQNGCTVQQVVTITEPAALSTTSLHTDANCGQSDGSASVTPSGGTSPYTYAWSNGSTNSSNPNISAGSYSVIITDANGCTTSATENVADIGAPSVTAVKTDVLCNGGNSGTATSTPSGGILPYTYLWSGNGVSGSGLQVTGLKAGTYTITVTGNNGCKVTTSVTVGEPTPLNVTIVSTNEVCANGQGTATVTANGGTGSYQYQWTGSSGSTQASVNNLGAGSYSVTVTDANGCSKTISTSVTNIANYGPNADFTMDPSITEILAPQIRFFDKTGGAATWRWDFGDGTADSVQNPVHNYKETGTYNVCLNITNTYGCSSDICYPVTIKPIWSIYIPNAFTPDGDGRNDFFGAYGTGIESYELYIFDRWGDLIFKSNSLATLWDGKSNNGSLLAQEDVYVYLVRVNDVFGKKHRYTGSVTLVR